MSDEEYKRVRKILLLTAGILFAIIIALAFLGSWQLTKLKNELSKLHTTAAVETKVIERTTPAYTPIKGIDYFDGSDGHNGINGKDGRTIINPVPYVVQGTQGPKGDRGDAGEAGTDGAPGKTVIIRINPETKLEECRFLGDIGWSPISECG